MSNQAKCPICDKAIAGREENKAFPFCSERCRMADLGKWLGEEYRIPADEQDQDPLDDESTEDRRD